MFIVNCQHNLSVPSYLPCLLFLEIKYRKYYIPYIETIENIRRFDKLFTYRDKHAPT